MRQISYITLDSIQEGVGQSQVLAYIRKLSITNQITLVSFEKIMPPSSLISELKEHGVNWKFISFGRNGIFGGILRFVRLLRFIPSSGIIHARSDIAAFAAVLRGSNKVIWDCRALMADHRRSLSASTYHRVQAFFFLAMERIIAIKSEKIIVITQAVIPILESRYSLPQNKFHHISTCVDVIKFRPSTLRVTGEEPIRILISGTLSPAYDIDLMNRILEKLRLKSSIRLTVALGLNHDKSWEKLKHVDQVLSLKHSEMPAFIVDSDFGFAIWRNDFGVALKSVAATKVAEFLACGVPVVVNSLQGDFGRLIPEHQVGVSVENNSDQEVERVASEIRTLAKDPFLSERCRNFALEYYSLEQAIPLLENIYQELDEKVS